VTQRQRCSSTKSARNIHQRPIAEIDELRPNLPLNAAFAAALDVGTGRALAIEFDGRAVTEDEPNFRSLADCVRLMCLPLPRDAIWFVEYRRVGKSLLAAFNKISNDGDERLLGDLERFVLGWPALPACTDQLSSHVPAAVSAAILGKQMAEHRVAAAMAEVRRRMKQEAEERRPARLRISSPT
jgi:ATP-dependent Lon protease